MRIGIDLGGTKIEFIALDSAGLARVRFRRNTPVANYPETIDLIARNVSTIEKRFSVKCLSLIHISDPRDRQKSRMPSSA